MHVLVGVDGSQRSYSAIRFISRLLSPERDRFTFHFTPPKIRLSSPAPIELETQQRAEAALIDRVFAEAYEYLPDPFHSQAQTMEGHGRPDRALLLAAEETDADLIVVGAQSGSHRLRFLMGGVARSVAHDAQLPVLVYRQHSASDDPRRLNVLFAASDTPECERAATVLRGMSWPPGAAGHLMHVLNYVEAERLKEWIDRAGSEASATWTQAYVQQIDQEQQRASATLLRLRDQLPPPFQHRPPRVVHGHVVEQIVKTVEAEAIDLVVVGARQLGPLARLLGSTTEGLLLQAPCAILLVHCQQNP